MRVEHRLQKCGARTGAANEKDSFVDHIFGHLKCLGRKRAHLPFLKKFYCFLANPHTKCLKKFELSLNITLILLS